MITTEDRAALSEGRSSDAIHETVAACLRDRRAHYELIVDLGCGQGDCARTLDGLYEKYIGCDVVRYDRFPETPNVSFRKTDLNRVPFPVEDASASAVVSVEVIEHIENPRALMREMVRIVRPGGWVVVTTPNQVNLTSKIYLLARDQFHAFQEAPGLYPAHITALVPQDLKRIAGECGLTDVEVRYTDRGRVPFSAYHWPESLGVRGKWFSDNVVFSARRP